MIGFQTTERQQRGEVERIINKCYIEKGPGYYKDGDKTMLVLRDFFNVLLPNIWLLSG